MEMTPIILKFQVLKVAKQMQVFGDYVLKEGFSEYPALYNTTPST